MQIRPLQDRVIVKRVEEEEKTKGGIIIPDTAKEKPIEGKVIAAGNGKVLEDGSVRKLDVKVGDVVLFGKYSGTEVKIDGEEHRVLEARAPKVERLRRARLEQCEPVEFGFGERRTIELRFNPMKRNLDSELDLDHIIHAALRGMDRACLEYDVKAGLIFCLAREFKAELNEIMVEKAIKYRNRGVVGIDLAGSEKVKKTGAWLLPPPVGWPLAKESLTVAMCRRCITQNQARRAMCWTRRRASTGR